MFGIDDPSFFWSTATVLVGFAVAWLAVTPAGLSLKHAFYTSTTILVAAISLVVIGFLV